jgi:hypothetical protein
MVDPMLGNYSPSSAGSKEAHTPSKQKSVFLDISNVSPQLQQQFIKLTKSVRQLNKKKSAESNSVENQLEDSSENQLCKLERYASIVSPGLQEKCQQLKQINLEPRRLVDEFNAETQNPPSEELPVNQCPQEASGNQEDASPLPSLLPEPEELFPIQDISHQREEARPLNEEGSILSKIWEAVSPFFKKCLQMLCETKEALAISWQYAKSVLLDYRLKLEHAVNFMASS